MTSTIWTPLKSCASTITSTHLIPVQLSLRTLLAIPMHEFVAAKGVVVGMNAICSTALIVPLTQQVTDRQLRCFKRGLLCFLSKSLLNAKRTSAVVLHTVRDLSLSPVAAGWALPLSPEVTASKHLLRCLGVFFLIPVLELAWSFGSERVVLAYLSAFTKWAFGALCAIVRELCLRAAAKFWTAGHKNRTSLGSSPCAWLH